jgi:hypothetical protein
LSLTFQYVLVRGAVPQLQAPEGPSFRGSRYDLAGWTAFIVDTEDLLSLAELEQLVATSSRAHYVALGNYVETSDYGYCIGASDGNIDFRFVVNPRGAEGLVEGMWALERCREASGSEAPNPETVEQVQSWAAKLGKTASAEDVLEILDRDWVYPEEGVREFVHLLEIPDIDWHWVP